MKEKFLSFNLAQSKDQLENENGRLKYRSSF